MKLTRLWRLVAMWTLMGPLLAWAQPAAGFTESMAADQQAATGIARLSKTEKEAIDALVGREITLAQQGGVLGFASTFVSRRTSDERARAGLSELTNDEQARLNDLVARAIATQPFASSYRYREKKPESTPTDAPRLEIHGELSFTYGWVSGGGSFKGGSIETCVTDPKSGLTLLAGYSEYQTNFKVPAAGWGVRRP